jgi:hypothetical protein
MKITPLAVLIFLLLIVGFFAGFGGPPVLPDMELMGRRGVWRAWSYCAALFVAEAGTACFGDQEYGLFPPTSLRGLFIALGVIAMVASAVWMDALLKTWPNTKRASTTS